MNGGEGTAKIFDAVLKEPKVKGMVWANVAFDFPKGNETDEKQNTRPLWSAVNCNTGMAMSLIIRRIGQTVLACCLAGAPAAPAAAQTAAVKNAVRGDGTNGTVAAGPATNAARAVPAAVTKNAPAAPPAGSSKNTVAPVEFTKLAGFEYLVPDRPDTNQVAGSDIADKQIPAEVKALDKKQVSVVGYLMPLKEEEGKSTEFLLMRTQSSCCFGIAPTITELITVKAAGAGVPTIMDELIEIRGTLRVGTVREDGYIVGVYRMEEGKYMGRSDR